MNSYPELIPLTPAQLEMEAKIEVSAARLRKILKDIEALLLSQPTM